MTKEQTIINKINAKVNFTYPSVTKRYIVGKELLHESKNPSLYYQNIYKDIYKKYNQICIYDTLTGLTIDINDLLKWVKI